MFRNFLSSFNDNHAKLPKLTTIRKKSENPGTFFFKATNKW